MLPTNIDTKYVSRSANPLTTHTTDHLIDCLQSWRGVGGDRVADEIEAELVERGVPYSDFRTQEAPN